MRDLTIEKFFDFNDLKPGDIGEDTISIHVDNNDAWLCAAAQITSDVDVTCTEPEIVDDSSCVAPDTDGELDGEVHIAFWKDDGDNVFEQGESTFFNGPISGLGQMTLADSSNTGPFGSTPIAGGDTVHIGKAWCFGALEPLEVPIPNNALTSPLVRGTGFTCDGSGVNNASQTDTVVGDLEFYATQSRNNDTFSCADDYTPSWE